MLCIRCIRCISDKSQTCPVCLNKVSKTLSDRLHNCPACKASMDRDYASALLIKKVALGIVSL